MKRFILIIIAALTFTGASAETQNQKFSKDEYKKNLKEFIVKEAELTQEESDKFFPIYNEMKKKQHELFKQMRTLSKECPKTEKECEEAIRKHDELDLEFKKVQQSYNTKMMKAIPASKLFKAIRAEDKFHRKALNKFNQKQEPNKKKPNADRKRPGDRKRPDGNHPKFRKGEPKK